MIKTGVPSTAVARLPLFWVCLESFSLCNRHFCSFSLNFFSQKTTASFVAQGGSKEFMKKGLTEQQNCDYYFAKQKNCPFTCRVLGSLLFTPDLINILLSI